MRIANISDIPAVQKLHAELFTYEDAFLKLYNNNYDESAASTKYFKSRINPENGRIFLAEEGGKVVGYLCAGKGVEEYREVPRYAEIESLFVVENCRGQNVGKLLINAFKEWARAEGINRLKVEVVHSNVRSLAFYQREGFLPTYLELESIEITSQ